jgi:hypothetical protein
MTTIVINENTKMGKLIMTIIKETNCGKIIQDNKKGANDCGFSHAPNKETIEALKEAKAGKTKKYESAKDLFKALDSL